MSRGEPMAGDGSDAADRARHAAALAAEADPELAFGPVLVAFERMKLAVCAGDLAAGALAARELEICCLALCVAPAASAAAADDRRGVMKIIVGWAWPRRPALAAVLEVNIAEEARRWGGAVAGRA